MLAFRGQFSKDERVCNHVVDSMARSYGFSSGYMEELANVLAVGKVVERALLIDDSDGRLLSTDPDGLDIVGRFS